MSGGLVMESVMAGAMGVGDSMGNVGVNVGTISTNQTGVNYI